MLDTARGFLGALVFTFAAYHIFPIALIVVLGPLQAPLALTRAVGAVAGLQC